MIQKFQYEKVDAVIVVVLVVAASVGLGDVLKVFNDKGAERVAKAAV